MKKILIICLLISISTDSLFSQNKTIKGRVIDTELQTLPMASITINERTEVGKTDFNGFFQITIPISVKKLSFFSIGFEPSTIELTDKCDNVEVIMILSSTYDFISLKKVDRLRKKEYMKLPKLHNEAFEKGIFKTDKACNIQWFIPYYEKKQKKTS